MKSGRPFNSVVTLIASVILLGSLVSVASEREIQRNSVGGPRLEIRHTAKHDSSRPLRAQSSEAGSNVQPQPSSITPLPGNSPTSEDEPDMVKPSRKKVMPRPRLVRVGPDEAAQRTEFGTAARTPFAPKEPTAGTGFQSLGEGFPGFDVDYAPPDTSMAVGPSQIIVMVNAGLVVHDKTGAVIHGPFDSNVIWDGFGGDCETQNDGDGVVRYDRLADRWIISQFAVGGANFYECIAVSKTADAAGEYWRYAFQFDDFPDYPKLSVWPDAYYLSYNMFDGGSGAWLGANVCATDRAAMLDGEVATQVCFATTQDYGGLLASDLDSALPPPDGAPNTVVSLGYFSDELAYWKFDVDFESPAESSFTGPFALEVGNFIPACWFESSWDCIEQDDSDTGLDSLDDRLMNRLAYQNFGTHQSLVVTHSVVDGDSIGVRWYELRIEPESTTPTVHQTGTYVPDSSSRWMSSAAQNQNGDIAIGYSKSSSTMFPAIAYTGRLASDPLDQMTMGETIAREGGGSQTGINRWGDYATMNIDPADDCTFWFATEYIPATGAFNWSTYVNSFTFPGCAPVTEYDFDFAVSEESATLAPGGTAQVEVTTNTTAGETQTIDLEATGLPAGVTAVFTPAELDEDGSSTVTFTATGSATPGTYPVDLIATASDAEQIETIELTITDFNFSLASTSGATTPQGSVSTTVRSTLVPGRRQNLSLSASDLPVGVRVSFRRSRISAGNSTTMQISTSASTPPGEHEITITATGTTYSISRTYTLTVSDFSVDRDPTTVTITKLSSSTITIDTEVTEGLTQTLNLSLVRPPRGVTGRFTPSRLSAGASSTLTLSVGRTARAGTYTITISARGSTLTKTTTVTLTINP